MLLGMVRAYGSKPRVRHSAGMCLASASCPASLHASTWFVSALLCGWGVADIAQRPCVFAERTTTGSVCVVCRITEFRFDPKLLDVRSRIVLGTVRQRAYCRPCAHPPSSEHDEAGATFHISTPRSHLLAHRAASSIHFRRALRYLRVSRGFLLMLGGGTAWDAGGLS